LIWELRTTDGSVVDAAGGDAVAADIGVGAAANPAGVPSFEAPASAATDASGAEAGVADAGAF